MRGREEGRWRKVEGGWRREMGGGRKDLKCVEDWQEYCDHHESCHWNEEKYRQELGALGVLEGFRSNK